MTAQRNYTRARKIVVASLIFLAMDQSLAATGSSRSQGYSSSSYGRQTYRAPVSNTPPARSTTTGSNTWSSSGNKSVRPTYSGQAFGQGKDPQARAAATLERSRAQRALIAQGPRPSADLQRTLDERQRASGNSAFFTGAFVAWLLSSGNHSNSDRQWLQSKLDALRSEGLDEDEPELLAPVSKGAILIDGPAQSKVGQAQQFVIQRPTGTGPISCTIEDQVRSGTNSLTIPWTPTREGAYLLTCESGKDRRRALVKVLPAS